MHVKNEHNKNNPLVIRESVSCSGIQIRSFWDVQGGEEYQNVWPRDRKLCYADNTVVVVYTESGKGIINVKNDNSFSIRGNSVIFLDPHEVENYGCVGLVWKLYWVELFVDENFKSVIPFNQLINIENKIHFQLQFDEMKQALSYNKKQYNAYAAAIFTKIFYEWLIDASYSNKTPQQKMVQNVIDEMHSRLADNWQVKEMANFAGCSEQHLRKLFMAQTGCSPKDYYLTIKLELAHTLLKKGQHNITQLSYELGFTDAFHLSKAFKRKYGFSPSEVIPIKKHLVTNLLA